MRISNLVLALILGAPACSPAPEYLVKVEHAVVQDERRLEHINDSYDLSEHDIGRTRLAVFELITRGHILALQLEQAARDFQMATVYNHLASNDFIRAATSYERAANTYRRIASLIILLASSGRFLDALCKQPMRVDRYHRMIRVFGVTLDVKDIEQLLPRIWGKQNVEQVAPDEVPLELRELPLPVMNELVKEATRMLLCSR